MSLIKCPECEKEISSESKQCLNCGYKIKKHQIKKDKIRLQNCKINKKSITIICIIIIIILLSILIIPIYNNMKVESVINDYYKNIIGGDYEKANEYLDENYDYSNNDYFNTENTNIFLSKYSYKIKNIKISKNSAIAIIKLTHPKLDTILSKYASYLSNNLFSKTKKEEQVYKKELLKNKNLKYETNEVQLLLKKKQSNWEICNNSNLESMIIMGKTSKISTNKLSDNEKQQAEYRNYIKNNLQLLNYKVGYSTNYSDEKVPSIRDIEIKNNGDKEITELTIQIDFLDENDKVIATRTITPISTLSQSLKSGYSWKLESDKYHEITNLDKKINIDKCNVKISDIKFGTTKETKLSEEQKYINDYIEIMSYKVKKYEKYTNEMLPGLGELAIKNKGGKELSKVYVTVYFQDESGNNIAENNILVIGGLFSEPNTLKSNYSWKMEDDKFYELTNLSSEVDISKNTIKVTEIEFSE